MQNIVRKLAIYFLAMSFFGAALLVSAQSNNASISGEITDPNGAVIPGAKLVLTSKDTKQTSTFVSDGNGLYTFRNVLPGTYQLTITAQGFGEYIAGRHSGARRLPDSPGRPAEAGKLPSQKC